MRALIWGKRAVEFVDHEVERRRDAGGHANLDKAGRNACQENFSWWLTFAEITPWRVFRAACPLASIGLHASATLARCARSRRHCVFKGNLCALF